MEVEGMADGATAAVVEGGGGFFSNMGNAICGVIFGFLLIVGSIALLGWNENRSACTAYVIDVAFSSAKTVTCDTSPQNVEDSVVFMNCALENLRLVSGDQVNNLPIGSAFSAVGACMRENILALQCVESSHTRTERVGRKTRTITYYTYKKEWRDSIAPAFRCTGGECSSARTTACGATSNPSGYAIPPSNTVGLPKGVTVGKLELGSALQGQIPCDAGVEPNTTMWAVTPTQGGQPPPSLTFSNTLPSGNRVDSCWNSEPLGCLRTTYFTNSAERVTLVSHWKNTQFEPFVAPDYWTCKGYTLNTLRPGDHTRDSFKQLLDNENSGLTWGLRAVGFFSMFIGVNLLFGPIVVLPTIIPCIGDFISQLIQGIVIIFSLIVSLILSFLVIGIAWVIVRPVVGAIVLSVVVALILIVIAIVYFVKKRRANKQQNNKVDVTGEANAQNQQPGQINNQYGANNGQQLNEMNTQNYGYGQYYGQPQYPQQQFPQQQFPQQQYPQQQFPQQQYPQQQYQQQYPPPQQYPQYHQL